jgi:hypothetical protein
MIRRSHLTTNATRRTLKETTSSVTANKKTCTCSTNRTQNEKPVFFTFSGHLRHFWVWPRVDGRSCGYLAGTWVEIADRRPFDSDFYGFRQSSHTYRGDNLRIRAHSLHTNFIQLSPLRISSNKGRAHAWVELCKTQISPSVRIEQLCSQNTDCHEISYLSIYWKSAQKIQVSIKLKGLTGTLHKNRYTFFFNLSPSILLRMRNVSDRKI